MPLIHRNGAFCKSLVRQNKRTEPEKYRAEEEVWRIKQRGGKYTNLWGSGTVSKKEGWGEPPRGEKS